MSHFKINQDTILTAPLPGAAALLKPVVFIDGKYYCVLLGQDPESGVYARARTLEKAFEIWHHAIRKHIEDADDYIVCLVMSLT